MPNGQSIVDFSFEPTNVINYVKGDAQNGYNDIRQHLKELTAALEECQDVFHGSHESATQNAITNIYFAFQRLIGTSETGAIPTGAWGTAYSMCKLLNDSYEVAKIYQNIQSQANLMKNF